MLNMIMNGLKVAKILDNKFGQERAKTVAEEYKNTIAQLITSGMSAEEVADAVVALVK